MPSEFDLFKPLVLVTGFGPFANHPVNASWEAVKLMDRDMIEEKHRVEFVTIELPVTYENVDEFVPALWETHTPKLMMHVGVSGQAKEISIETQAHRKGYKRMDYFDKCPANHVCPSEGAIRIQTKLNVDKICEELSKTRSPGSVSVLPSYDAGRYVCEYTYYTSLSIDKARTVFVHVPNTNVCSSSDVAKALENILQLCLQQIDEANKLTDKLEKTNLSDDEDD